MNKAFLATAAAVALVCASLAGAKSTFPNVIALPNGWQPEGISVGNGTTFYVGSIPTGAVYRGDLRTGKGATLVQGASGRAAIGIEHDRGRIFVAGGTTGKAFVYDADPAPSSARSSSRRGAARRSSTTSRSRVAPRTSPTPTAPCCTGSV